MYETANLKLPYIAAAQSQKHVTHNEAIRALDAIVHLSVVDRDLSEPPSSPSEGARYIPAASATGAWSGQAGSIAAFQDGAWFFYAPVPGWVAWIADEDTLVAWDGTQWVLAGAGPDNLTRSGAQAGGLAAWGSDTELVQATPGKLKSVIGEANRHWQYGPVNIVDDTALAWQPIGGLFTHAMVSFNTNSNVMPMGYFYMRGRDSPSITEINVVDNFSLLDTATGVLTGTTGVDGRITLSVHSDGTIYIENRRGYTIPFSIEANLLAV